MAQKKKKKKKKYKVRLKRVIPRVMLLLLCILLVAIVLKLFFDAKDIYSDAKSASNELSGLMQAIKSESFNTAQIKVEKVHNIIKEARAKLESPVWKIGNIIPKYGKDFKSGVRLLKLVDEMMDKYVDEGFDILRETPLSSLKSGNNINVRAISNYLSLLEDAMPDIEELIDESSTLLDSLNGKGLLKSYSDKIQKVQGYVDLFNNAKSYIPLLDVVLSGGEDRNYIIVAQNTAEIRASGGFPGAMGMMSIKNGYLNIGGFSSVTNFLPSEIHDWSLVSDIEWYLFDVYMQYPRDACYDPYFPTVARIWAESYEWWHGQHIDGIISLTPAIIQDILAVTGSVTLSNGVVLDGTNTTKYIQGDIYIEYMNSDMIAYYGGYTIPNEITDGLFAEVAQLALSQAFSHINTETVPRYLEVVEKRIKDRVIMLWMADEEEEAVIKQYGVAGDFNTDPNNPQLGVYYSNCNPGKMGWYLDLDIKVEDADILDDGSLRYPVTVSMHNILDWDTAYYAGEYIAGSISIGYLMSYLYVVAPAGGYISDYWMDNGSPMGDDWYVGNHVAFCKLFYIAPLDTVTAHFYVTTAPGVDTPLTVVNTPTLQEYR